MALEPPSTPKKQKMMFVDAETPTTSSGLSKYSILHSLQFHSPETVNLNLQNFYKKIIAPKGNKLQEPVQFLTFCPHFTSKYIIHSSFTNFF